MSAISASFRGLSPAKPPPPGVVVYCVIDHAFGLAGHVAKSRKLPEDLTVWSHHPDALNISRFFDHRPNKPRFTALTIQHFLVVQCHRNHCLRYAVDDVFSH